MTVRIQQARCLRATDRAILVVSTDWPTPTWIPQGQVHDDSEVWRPGDTGTLVVSAWVAEQKGWT